MQPEWSMMWEFWSSCQRKKMLNTVRSEKDGTYSRRESNEKLFRMPGNDEKSHPEAWSLKHESMKHEAEKKGKKVRSHTLAGNRTRVSPVAGEYSTTRPRAWCGTTAVMLWCHAKESLSSSNVVFLVLFVVFSTPAISPWNFTLPSAKHFAIRSAPGYASKVPGHRYSGDQNVFFD